MPVETSSSNSDSPPRTDKHTTRPRTDRCGASPYLQLTNEPARTAAARRAELRASSPFARLLPQLAHGATPPRRDDTQPQCDDRASSRCDSGEPSENVRLIREADVDAASAGYVQHRYAGDRRIEGQIRNRHHLEHGTEQGRFRFTALHKNP